MENNKFRMLLTMSALILSCGWATAQESSEPFEGEIMYENTVTSSKGMQRLYPSLLKDGSYEMQYVIKGDLRKTSDSYAGLVQYLNRTKDIGYVYSPLLKKGFKFKISQTEAIQEKKFKDGGGHSAPSTGEVKEIEGLKCHHYKGDFTMSYDLLGTKMTIDCKIDYWACLDFEPTFVGSIKVEGMPILFDEMQIATFPILGSQKQHQNVTVTEAKRRQVDLSEVTPPSDVTYTLVDDGVSAFYKLQKEISKYIKKNKLTDSGVKIHHGKTEDTILDDAWD